MSALREEIEAWESPKAGGRRRHRSSPESLMFAKLAPYRAEAMDLGFTLLRRDCSSAEESSRRCVDTFVHPRGIWLDLVGNVDPALPFGPILAKFRAWRSTAPI